MRRIISDWLYRTSDSLTFSAHVQESGPDHLIVEALLKQIETEYDDWYFGYKPSAPPKEIDPAKWGKHWYNNSQSFAYYNEKKDLHISFTYHHQMAQGRWDPGKTWVYGVTFKDAELTINRELELSASACEKFVHGVWKIHANHEKRQAELARSDRLADNIRRSQEQTEKKWVFAENLLGYRRNAEGALEPVKQVCHNCDSIPCECNPVHLDTELANI